MAALCYLPAILSLEYAWDDWQLIINNPMLRDADMLWQGLIQPILPGTTYLRPLVLASFAFEFRLFGDAPSTAHAINLGLHVANTVLVGWIAGRLVDGTNTTWPWRALLAALIYGLHPALIEPVAWVAGRFDLMVTFFMLLAIRAYLSPASTKRTAFVTACFLLAALSKEMAATLPILLALTYMVRSPQPMNWESMWKRFLAEREWQLFAALLCAGLVYVGGRYLALGALGHADNKVASQFDGIYHHAAFVGQTTWFYLKMSLWPFADINPQHPVDPSLLTSGERLQGIVVLVSLACISAISVWRRSHTGILFVMGWVALLPVLNIIPLTIGGNIGHDRFLTFPIAPLAWAVAQIRIRKVSPAMQRAAPVLITLLSGLWLILAGLNVRVTTPLWQNNYTLWYWTYTRHPDVPYVQFNYASAAILYRRLDEAKLVLDAMQRGRPNTRKDNTDALVGYYLIRRGEFQAGLDHLRKVDRALSWLPHHELARRNVPLAAARVTRHNAEQWFYQFMYTAMAEASLALRQFEDAEEFSDIATLYNPYYPPAWLMKSYAYYGLDKWDSGEETYRKTLLYYNEQARGEAADLRQQFLRQLCEMGTQTSPTTCREWHRQRDKESKQNT